MKETQWDDSVEDSKEFFDASIILPDEDIEDGGQDEDEPTKAACSKTHITELRRRIEERIDSKRIEHEFDYDDLDDLDDLLDSMS